jgi:hypothetical protein
MENEMHVCTYLVQSFVTQMQHEMIFL